MGLIAGVTVGAIGALAALGLLGFFIWRHHSKKQATQAQMSSAVPGAGPHGVDGGFGSGTYNSASPTTPGLDGHISMPPQYWPHGAAAYVQSEYKGAGLSVTDVNGMPQQQQYTPQQQMQMQQVHTMQSMPQSHSPVQYAMSAPAQGVEVMGSQPQQFPSELPAHPGR